MSMNPDSHALGYVFYAPAFQAMYLVVMKADKTGHEFVLLANTLNGRAEREGRETSLPLFCTFNVNKLVADYTTIKLGNIKGFANRLLWEIVDGKAS